MANRNNLIFKSKSYLNKSLITYILLAFDTLLVILILGIFAKNNFYLIGANWLTKPIVKHGLLIGFLLLLTWVIAVTLILQGETIAKEWSKGLRNSGDFDENDDFCQKNIQVYLKHFQAAENEKQRIVEQLQEIKRRAKSHFKIMSYFYVRYYTSIAITSSAAIIAAICLIFISKEGLTDANQYVINLFLVSSSIGILFGTFPAVFKQEKNVSDNKALYLRYIALEQQILTYLATGRTQIINKGQNQEVKDFIYYLDKQMETINQLAIGFDSTRIPKYQDIYPENFKF